MRKLRVWGERNFTITVPDDAKVTFGPWSPPRSTSSERFGPERGGTLRIYKGTKATENVVAVFAGVRGFREETLNYEEEPALPPLPPVPMPSPWSVLDDDEKKELAAMAAEAIINASVDGAGEPAKDPEPWIARPAYEEDDDGAPF